MTRRIHLRDLAVDSIVIVEVVEALTDKHFIVNFDGALVRVENQTAIPLKAKQRVHLRVTSILPLSFQLIQQQRKKRNFDVSV